MKSEQLPINNDIRAYRVVLIDSDGNKRGEFVRDDAIRLAEADGLDLVVVGGDPANPVCKIMDHGKHLYAQKKKQKKNTTSAAASKLKEIKIGFVSDGNYVNIKTRQAEKFLRAGNRVKVTVRFKGREATHIDMIVEKCRNVYFDVIKNHEVRGFALDRIATMDSEPRRAGRQVTMVLSPRKVYLDVETEDEDEVEEVE